jgi:hypothetical protein
VGCRTAARRDKALLLAQADGERQSGAVGDQFAGRIMRSVCVTFVNEPRLEPYGQVVVFIDVAGNRWDLRGPRPVR